MTTIKASCPTCGEVEITSVDVRLMVCNVAARSYYAFWCPDCHDEVKKSADDHVISLLMSGGVDATAWEIPAEVLEAHTGEPLSYDDLLDLVTALDREPAISATALKELV